MPLVAVTACQLQTWLLVGDTVLPLPLLLPAETTVVEAEEFGFAVCGLFCKCIWTVHTDIVACGIRGELEWPSTF